MPKVTVIDWSGESHKIEAREGMTLMEAIRHAGISDLAAICGGCCSCATCHVYVDPDWLDRLPEQEEDERELVTDTSVCQPNSRLSCQIRLTPDLDGLSVTIAPEE